MATEPDTYSARARRGSIARPVSSRIYRAGWAGAVVALLVAAFTVGRLEPLPGPKLEPSFDGATAVQFASEFAHRFPDRTPGTPEAVDADRWVAARLGDYGLKAHRQAFSADVPGLGEKELVNLIAVAPGRSPEAIVVMAHRDNAGLAPGANGNASGTGALLELARNVASSDLAHTLVFLSTDGGAFGGLGADAFAADPSVLRNLLGQGASIAAVVNLDSIAGDSAPAVLFTGDTPRSPAGTLLATAIQSVEADAGATPVRPDPLGQLVDLAFPFSLYEQAPFVARGIPALTLTSAGVRPPVAADDTLQRIHRVQLGALGRSAQELLASLDASPEMASGTQAYIAVGSRFLRGWTIQLLLLAALIPFLAAAVDLFARCRRRHVALLPALRSLRSRLGAWAWAGALFGLFALAGLLPGGSPRPLNPDTPAVTDPPYAALVALAVLAGVGWLVARSRLVPDQPATHADELGGYLAALLALAIVALVVAASNPFALIFVLPSLHAWLWLPHVQDRPLPARLALYAMGFLGPLLLLLSLAFRYELGLGALWYLAALVSVGYVSLPLVAAALAWAAIAAQVGALAFGRYAPYPEPGARPARGPIREAIRRAVLLSRRRRARLELVEAEEPDEAEQ